MGSAATSYAVPGLGTIAVTAQDGRVKLTRSVAGTVIDTVVVTFVPDEEPNIQTGHTRQPR